MKRDLELIRKILLEIENKPDDYEIFVPQIPNYTKEEISYHIGLLAQAGYVDAVDFYGNDQHDWHAKSLTWEGREFLDAARNDNAWNWAKEQMSKISGGFVLPVLKDLLIEFIRRKAFGGD